MTDDRKTAQADLENLYRVFTVPEAPNSTLSKIEREISHNLVGFLQEHIVALEKDLPELEKNFSQSQIAEDPIFVSEQADFLLEKLVAHSVHTASPSFIGHMTSALPYFMLPLSKILIALNQNLVKIETSKAFTPLERQVVGMLHRLVYNYEEDFYRRWMHDQDHALGVFCSGGTIANMTALWASRNHAFPPDGVFRGVTEEGMYRALKYYGYDGAAIVVSERGHYSLHKAADVLGLGRQDVHTVPVDSKHKVDLKALEETCRRLNRMNIKILAIVGVAGASETGSVDPLQGMAAIAQTYNTHFHVDAAWGGPTLFSRQYADLLNGIDCADSVTIDAHKQLYVPMGAGMVVFKDPACLKSIEHHALYIIRKGSKDLGSHSLEGSRSGMAMLVQSGLRIIGRKGYELLIDLGIQKARTFAGMIRMDPDFELISEPELNILTYRYNPASVQALLQQASPVLRVRINRSLNTVTRLLQKIQRSRGKSFVSRTSINVAEYDGDLVVVFRVVLANPLTTEEILREILQEQKQLAQEASITGVLKQLDLTIRQLAPPSYRSAG